MTGDPTALHRQAAILVLWFGEIGPEGLPPEDRRRLWFTVDPAFDTRLRAEFGGDLTRATAGEPDA